MALLHPFPSYSPKSSWEPQPLSQAKTESPIVGSFPLSPASKKPVIRCFDRFWRAAAVAEGRGRIRSQKLRAAGEGGGGGGGREGVLDAGPAPGRESPAGAAEYDWRQEWYPLYLTRDVPEDAPLGLSVFDQRIVLFRDGAGRLRCFEDRCPHRLAKLSEGQLVGGRLECLYHGWQFDEHGACVRIPQLPAGAKIPQSACVSSYEVADSQGVAWVWMSRETPPDASKLPWFENFARPGFQDISTTHELPYDHSILLENLMDPAHIPISHDRTDWTARREDAQPLLFKVMERTGRGFAGHWGKADEQSMPNFLRFEAPCVLQNNRESVDGSGEKHYFSGLFLCRPAGQGRSMLIVRFGGTRRSWLLSVVPVWYMHQNASKVFEQDMGFLSSQNEVLMREKAPTMELYHYLRSSDTWVEEYRKWTDTVGGGMPYHFGHRTVSLPSNPAVVEHAPAGLAAGFSASSPAKGGFGSLHLPDMTNRYFRHVIHCKVCRRAVKAWRGCRDGLAVVAVAAAGVAVLVNTRQWRSLFLALSVLCLGGAQACAAVVRINTTNFVREHRRL